MAIELTQENFPAVTLETQSDGSMKVKEYVAAFKNFFGMKPGQKIKDFGEELKGLTELDKAQIMQGIADGSLNYVV